MAWPTSLSNSSIQLKGTSYVVFWACIFIGSGHLRAVEPSLQEQLNAQRLEIRLLSERIERYDKVFGPVEARDELICDQAHDRHRVPVTAELGSEPSCSGTPDTASFFPMQYQALYDKGFVLRPLNPATHPYELKTNGWIQFRHHMFARDQRSWTDNAAVTRPIRNRNVFDIERARLTFRGFAIDKRLTYFLQLDGDSDGRHTVDFFDYWWSWKCSDCFRVLMGKRKVSASRQWLLGARDTRFVDRPISVDFFRPDRTLGIWGIGKIAKAMHYEVMVGNGYRTGNVPAAGTDNQLTFAATGYWDPWGAYGQQLVDFENTSKPLSRIGHSFVYSSISSNNIGVPLAEATFARLGDGTLLTDTGAITAGVTISDYDVLFYGVDAALKWRRWSFNGELFLRWLSDLRGDGILPAGSVFQNGYYAEGGYFVVPKRLDLNLRYSGVHDDFGNRSEKSIGLNYYPKQSPSLKLSLDVTCLDGSPLNNTATDILVGDDGLLLRTQFQAQF